MAKRPHVAQSGHADCDQVCLLLGRQRPSRQRWRRVAMSSLTREAALSAVHDVASDPPHRSVTRSILTHGRACQSLANGRVPRAVNEDLRQTRP